MLSASCTLLVNVSFTNSFGETRTDLINSTAKTKKSSFGLTPEGARVKARDACGVNQDHAGHVAQT